MQEQLITFETAQLAQEKGFSENVDFCYDSEEKNIEDPYVYNVGDLSGDDELYAPTQSLLQKWLREVHNIHIAILPKILPSNQVKYYSFKGKLKKNFENLYNTYEEALEIGLQEALKLI